MDSEKEAWQKMFESGDLFTAAESFKNEKKRRKWENIYTDSLDELNDFMGGFGKKKKKTSELEDEVTL